MIGRATLPLLAMLLMVGPVWAADPLAPFYGSFVGSGLATYPGRGRTERRDLDVTVAPSSHGGFTLSWITVTRGEGNARTGAGVKRRAVEDTFVPFDGRDGVYVLAPDGGMFKKAELPNPLRGGRMRWASVDGNTLTVYSVAITEDGGPETQIYQRQLTASGIAVDFLRMENETVKVRVAGELVRVD